MTAQLLSRERLEERIRAEIELLEISLKNGGSDSPHNDEELLEVFRLALAAHEQEPVAYMYRDNLHTDARFSLEPRIRNWSPEDISEYEISETPLYAHPAPVPAVPENQNTPHFDTIALDTAREIMCDVNRRADFLGGDIQLLSRIQCRIDDACRAAIQPNVTLTYEGDNHTEHNLGMVNHIGEDTGTDEVKPVTAATVPAGYALVPVEPTQEMLTASYVFAHIDNTADSWKAMLAAAPTAPDGWIPVSDRMPEPGRWLALYGAPVFTRGNDAGKPWHEFTVDEGYLDKEDGKFYLFNWESPGQIGDSYNNLLATATHWMYWELPDAPKVPGSQLTPTPENRLQKAIVDACMVFLHGCDSLSKNYECDFSDSETETSFCIANIAKKIGVVEETGNRRWSLSQQMRGEIEEVYRKYAMRIMEAAPKVTP